MSAGALEVYLGALFGAEPRGAFVELRWKRTSGMGQRFFPNGGEAEFDPIAEAIRSITSSTDIYIGVAPRTCESGGRDSIERVHVVWADCDSPESIEALERFRPKPSIVLDSGHGRHAYWAVFPPVNPDEAEKVNRALAQILGADERATDAARILRPPETFNFKNRKRLPVKVLRLEPGFFDLEALEDASFVEPEPPRPPKGPPRFPPSPIDEALATISPRFYVEALIGQEVSRSGKISCPFHDDRTPSLHVYEDPDKGWYCFGCGRGGTAIDFAAELWNVEPRGDGFNDLLDRLADELLQADGRRCH